MGKWTFVLLGAAAAATATSIWSSRSSTTHASDIQTSQAPLQGNLGGEALPPGHPSINSTMTNPNVNVSATNEVAAITWKVPVGWEVVPNPNAIRIATYRITSAKGDAAEVSVSRAGGDVDANIARWLDQFDGAGRETRATKSVRGFAITTVDISGAYEVSPTEKHDGWALHGAIVATPGTSYFFKMLGPVVAVQSSRKAFDAMIDGIKPPAAAL